tara:strand:+ start:141 stop:392 length:252 start_codon:yes stop_codon:yes gene_type:complete
MLTRFYNDYYHILRSSISIDSSDGVKYCAEDAVVIPVVIPQDEIQNLLNNYTEGLPAPLPMEESAAIVEAVMTALKKFIEEGG